MRWIAGLGISAGLALSVATCALDQRCGGPPVDVRGTPAQLTIPPGVQPEGYELVAPQLCPDGITALSVRGAGTQSLTAATADPFFRQLLAGLKAQGGRAHGPGLTAFECGDSSKPSPYLYFLQLEDWAWADATVRALGSALVRDDLDDTVGIWVGQPRACPD